MPSDIDKPLRLFKYVILFFTIWMAWYYGTLWMSPYDPYAAFGHITSMADTIAEDPLNVIGFILLFVTLLGSLFYDRFFCKYMCPAGALFAILGKISPTWVERDEKLCIHCQKCSTGLPNGY